MDGLALNIAKYVVNKALYSVALYMATCLCCCQKKLKCLEFLVMACATSITTSSIVWLERGHMLSPSRLDGLLYEIANYVGASAPNCLKNRPRSCKVAL
jgi:hypothetical protein